MIELRGRASGRSPTRGSNACVVNLWLLTHRVKQIVQEIREQGAHVVGLEEVDKMEDLAQKLSPRLVLAAFKHRKVKAIDDGAALLYDPQVGRWA